MNNEEYQRRKDSIIDKLSINIPHTSHLRTHASVFVIILQTKIHMEKMILHLPHELIVQILLRLPVKLVLVFSYLSQSSLCKFAF